MPYNEVGSSADGDTIITDGNGDLAVAPSTVILGDFENDFGNWSSNNWTRKTDNGGAESTSTYCHFNSTVTQSDSRTYDLTNATELIIYLSIDQASFGRAGNSNDKAQILIDGTIKASLTGGSRQTWQKFTIDVSNMSGSKTLKCKHVNNSGTNFVTGYDRIKTKEKSITTTSDGSGGTS